MRTQPGSETKTAAYRQLVATEGIAALAEILDDVLDLRSGPGLALTAAERLDRAACRQRFGHYDPANIWHRRYLDTLRQAGLAFQEAA